jgi:hypothetical protein
MHFSPASPNGNAAQAQAPAPARRPAAQAAAKKGFFYFLRSSTKKNNGTTLAAQQATLRADVAAANTTGAQLKGITDALAGKRVTGRQKSGDRKAFESKLNKILAEKEQSPSASRNPSRKSNMLNAQEMLKQLITNQTRKIDAAQANAHIFKVHPELLFALRRHYANVDLQLTKINMQPTEENIAEFLSNFERYKKYLKQYRNLFKDPEDQNLQELYTQHITTIEKRLKDLGILPNKENLAK